MAILKIARMGHPVLRRSAERVTDPTAPEIEMLVRDMIETMVDAPGVGLAAPQVHVGCRVVVFHVPESRANGGEAQPLTALINPEIEILTSETVAGWEGCLSIPGMMGEVSRALHIGYRGFDLAGRVVEREAKGFHARVVQHECDHLDGILYPMRITDLSRFGFSDELQKGFAEEEERSGSGDDSQAAAD